jgi:hypothetical protein
MLKYIRKNIDYAQKQAIQKISLFLNNIGYALVTDSHNTNAIETRVFQWMDSRTNHCIQLIWDGKENWFELGEFQNSGDLNHFNANQIIIVSVKTQSLLCSKKYVDYKVDNLIEALKKYSQNTLKN